MELIARLFGFFQNTDSTSQGLLLLGAFVALVSATKAMLLAVKAFLKILAPLTDTKIDDTLLGIFTKLSDGTEKLYLFLAKMVDHGGAK